jgi:hypothetical protein
MQEPDGHRPFRIEASTRPDLSVPLMRLFEERAAAHRVCKISAFTARPRADVDIEGLIGAAHGARSAEHCNGPPGHRQPPPGIAAVDTLLEIPARR